MKICFLRIENFRGIKKAEIPIASHNAFLGSNNSGKTAIAHALGMLFGREHYYQNISEYDFFGGNPGASSRFTIVGTLTDFHPSINDPAEFPEWFNTERGARVAWWNEKTRKVSYEINSPEGAKLAVEIAISGRYDDENCEFETRKYFYDGEIDPFSENQYIPFPNKLLPKVGFFLIPSLRQWDWILSFGSGQFLKLLREINKIPAEQINAFKEEMRNPNNKIEQASPFKELIEALEKELREFSLMPESSEIVYRTTQLSTRSVLESLVPHIKNDDSILLPFSRQGSGFTSIQLMLVLLQFAIQRKSLSENTIFFAEEPELHLQPSLQRRLINRLRANSNQIMVTTHSPHISSMFKPSEVVYLTNDQGFIKPEIVYSGNISDSSLGNQARQLYLRDRANFYEALLGQYILVPEGIWDWQWLRLWIRVAEASAIEEPNIDIKPNWSLSGLEIMNTRDSAVIPTLKEIRRFRNDVFALIDGDKEGKEKLKHISRMDDSTKPKAVIQFGEKGEIEDLVAWLLEPSFDTPGLILKSVLENTPRPWSTEVLGNRLKEKELKDNWESHENLAWEAYNHSACQGRIITFLSDLARICQNQATQIPGWKQSKILPNNVLLYTAEFIRNLAP